MAKELSAMTMFCLVPQRENAVRWSAHIIISWCLEELSLLSVYLFD